MSVAQEEEAELANLERVARLLDARFRIPFTPVRFGVDSLVGLVPGVGDALALIPAAWLLYRAFRLGAPAGLLARMGANVALDAGVGAVPVLGDVFDVAFKSNRRNMTLLRRHLDARR